MVITQQVSNALMVEKVLALSTLQRESKMN